MNLWFCITTNYRGPPEGLYWIHTKGNETQMRINDLLDSIKLTEELALENYQQRNGVVDYRLDGVCNHYFPVYEGSEPSFKNGEIVLTCKVSKTVKGQMRYTFQIDGKRIAEKRIVSEFLALGAFQG
jgi:hypothetical protein